MFAHNRVCKLVNHVTAPCIHRQRIISLYIYVYIYISSFFLIPAWLLNIFGYLSCACWIHFDRVSVVNPISLLFVWLLSF